MSSYTRRIALALIIAFVASLGVWSFNPARISHDLNHDRLLAQLSVVDHAHDHDAGKADSDTVNDVGHDLLHAAGQIQPMPLSSFAWIPPAHGGPIPTLFVPPVIAHSTREPPFRPPRSTFS